MKKWLLPVLLSFLFLVPGLCWAQKGGFVFMASTIGPIDSGIVGALEDQFEKDTGIRVRHVGAGTGAALKIAEHGKYRSRHGPRQIVGGEIHCRGLRH